MQASQAPAKFPVVWASGAGAGYVRTVPVPSQIGTTPGAASFTDGFPPLNFLDPQTQGGVPPFGEDLNGVIKALTAAMQALQAGMGPSYDATFQTAIGGYPNGAAIIAADGTHFWRSTVDNNMSDPDTGGANWTVLRPGTYAFSDLTGVPTFVLASAFTGSNQSLGTSGYQKLPGGLILQWGTYTGPGGSTIIPITLPIAFPTQALSASVTTNDDSQIPGVDSITLTTLNAKGGGGASFYMALGR